MKLKDLKHNHSLTDLLKVLIFSILMLLPFIAVGTRCLYVICNKNAYQNYSGSNEIQYNDISNISDIKIGNKYLFNSQLGVYNDTTTKNTNVIFYDDITNINTQNNNLLGYLEQGNNFRFYYSNEPIAIYVYDNQTAIGNIAVNSGYPLTFEFTIENYNSADLSNNFSFLKEINLSNNFNLDNVFEYSVNKLENSELFTWTQNTAVYTGVNAMTTSLQIQGTAIPMLITYWFLLTVIYVILDIVIKLFTVLTHLIGSKATEK